MKKPQRRNAPRSRAAEPRRRAARGWELVRVDQRPLRRKAASECSRELAKVEKARAEWRRFDREDKPAFERWMAGRFGAVLTELRELDLALREKEQLIAEVEIEYAWIGVRSYRAAYLSVMRRRNAPVRRRSEHAADARHFADLSEKEKRTLFDDFIADFLDVDPADIPKEEYQRMYRDFQAGLGGERPEPAPARPARAADARLKEVYRQLVRRLHPDTRADGDPEVSALWHEVQEAYAAGQVERLETLLALTDLRGKSAGEHISLFQMREVLAELRRALRVLQKSLRDARKDPAWNFARRVNRDALGARLERSFQRDLAARKRRLQQCEARIARWSRPRPAKAKRRWFSELQIEFGF
jgi:hypothetical protein